MIRRGVFLILLLCALACSVGSTAQTEDRLHAFAEWGASLHGGNHTPLWQNANRHGLSSLDNNSYLRSGVFFTDSFGSWQLCAGLDLVAAAGFTSTFIVQQAYADVSWKWLCFSVGSKEIGSALLNQTLSSGGLTWSGNARPVPQVWIGTADYVQLLPRLAMKAELSYGWFTDSHYQQERWHTPYFYTHGAKYHHKGGFLRIGIPEGHWQLDLGLTLDAQFGGRWENGTESIDLGNRPKDFLRVIIPLHGEASMPEGEQIQYQGNFMGSEHARLTYRTGSDAFSLYVENYYDDLSGMAKQNGWDGLWGVEWRSSESRIIDNVVLEYYQTTNQSGPMHGLDYSVVQKTTGADDYYNNDLYPSWSHWGQTLANPLIASPLYNTDGDLSFKLNRVKALHMGWSGSLHQAWRYTAKASFNRSWGTPFRPVPDIRESFSIFASVFCSPRRLEGWSFFASLAADMGDIYGDNIGMELKVHKTF